MAAIAVSTEPVPSLLRRSKPMLFLRSALHCNRGATSSHAFSALIFRPVGPMRARKSITDGGGRLAQRAAAQRPQTGLKEDPVVVRGGSAIGIRFYIIQGQDEPIGDV